MTIIRWNQRPMLSNLIDNFFEREFSTGFERNCGCVPATNIMEKDDHYEIQLIAPGLSKEDFKLEVENNLLSISYEKKQEEENKESDQFLRREYSAEGFTRSFTIPKQSDIEKIGARYENGILYVSVPRENPEKTRISKRIEIA